MNSRGVLVTMQAIEGIYWPSGVEYGSLSGRGGVATLPPHHHVALV